MLKVLFGGIKTNLTILLIAVPDVIHPEPHAPGLRFSLFYGEPIVRYELHSHIVKIHSALRNTNANNTYNAYAWYWLVQIHIHLLEMVICIL